MRCKFPSRKNGRLVHCEGLLELDAAYLFELHPQIVRYGEQPAPITYADGDRIRRYTPDFELHLTCGSTVWIEVKPIRSLAEDEVHRKMVLVQSAMRCSRRRLLLLTDRELRSEPLQSNARTIYRLAENSLPTVAAAEVAVLKHAEMLPLPLAKAVAVFADAGSNVYSLLLLGALRCDLSRPIGPRTLVYLAKDQDHEWLCLSQERDL